MPNEIDLFREFIAGEKDYALGQPATEQEIAAFEAKYNIRLPDDVREYFLKINGINGMDTDGFISIEPLKKWCLVTEYQNSFYTPESLGRDIPDADTYFRLGHYDISVWDWFIKLDTNQNTETPVYVYYEKLTKIADNFSEFLKKFRTESTDDILGYS